MPTATFSRSSLTPCDAFVTIAISSENASTYEMLRRMAPRDRFDTLSEAWMMTIRWINPCVRPERNLPTNSKLLDLMKKKLLTIRRAEPQY